MGERRPHLAGAVGAALAMRCSELGRITHMRDARALKIPPKGERGFAETFGITLRAEPNDRAALQQRDWRPVDFARSILLRMFDRPKGVLGRLGGLIMARTNA
jgi:hypothetical protein